MGIRATATVTVQAAASKNARAAARAFSDTAPFPDQDRQDSLSFAAVANGATALNTEALRCARDHIAKFAAPDDARSARVVGLTLVLWVVMLYTGVWWFRHAPLTSWWGLAGSALWVFIRIGTYVRAFVLMHDATHGALFTKRWMNNWAGIITGLMNAMDAPDYQKTHAQHHALLGIEEEVDRDPDITVLWTTKDWAAWPRGISKAAARVLCDPLFFFTVFAPWWIMAFNGMLMY